MFRGAVACSSRFCPRASINRDVIRAYSSSNVAPTTISSLIYPENQPSLSNESDRNPVTVQGFVRSIRKQKNVAFVSLGDGTTLKPLQVVLSPHQVEGYDLSTLYFIINSDMLFGIHQAQHRSSCCFCWRMEIFS